MSIILIMGIFSGFIIKRSNELLPKMIIVLLSCFVLIQLVNTAVTPDRIYYHFGHNDMDKISRYNYRYTKWITQFESSCDVICNLHSINPHELFFNTPVTDYQYWAEHSAAFNFPIYWWARLYLLYTPLWLILLVPLLSFLIGIILFRTIRKRIKFLC